MHMYKIWLAYNILHTSCGFNSYLLDVSPQGTASGHGSNFQMRSLLVVYILLEGLNIYTHRRLTSESHGKNDLRLYVNCASCVCVGVCVCVVRYTIINLKSAR